MPAPRGHVKRGLPIQPDRSAGESLEFSDRADYPVKPFQQLGMRRKWNGEPFRRGSPEPTFELPVSRRIRPVNGLQAALVGGTETRRSRV